MTLFSKSSAEYIRFQKILLSITAAVGLARLLLSLAGASDIAGWFSITAMTFVSVVLYPIMVHTKGFGGYKQVLVLLFIQLALAGALITLGIAIAVATGSGNVFTGGQEGSIGSEITHMASHLIGGSIIFAAILWLPASVVLFVTKHIAPSPGEGS
jgi:hypothetical protein